MRNNLPFIHVNKIITFKNIIHMDELKTDGLN
jgi:hypothetical protein